MHCKHCGFVNGEDEHRCLKCGRRIAGIVIAAPPGYAGANALAWAPAQVNDINLNALNLNETQDILPAHAAGNADASQPPAPARLIRPSQPTLFLAADQKVIPFDEIQRHVANRTQATGATVQRPVLSPSASRVNPKRNQGPVVEQGSFDLVSAEPAQRTEKVEFPKVVETARPVATPQHRAAAAMLDGAMILSAFGLFCAIIALTGAGFGTSKIFWLTLGSSFALISMFYGSIWMILGTETAGMTWTDLELIAFDGLPVDGPSRAVRFAATWLSFCSGGLGLVWALADEENLTWHDHISKTFPTFREHTPSN